ncbi:MAG: hypothetical protein JWN76_1862 [Chitinophagaceae bacterium]|nr:hypothetical protein [Chitinophagaceae bacterium]
MEERQLKVVVIHDGLEKRAKDPLLIELEENFGDDNVSYFENSNEGCDYVIANIDQKMVVILDVNFSNGELSGTQVFDRISRKSKLIYVIMITANSLEEIAGKDIEFMINNDAFAIATLFDYEKIIGLVYEALHKMSVRVDSVIEEWIVKHPAERRQTPLLKYKDGRTYTMNDLLESIRQQSDVGKNFEKDVLKLAVDLLARQKLKLND